MPDSSAASSQPPQTQPRLANPICPIFPPQLKRYILHSASSNLAGLSTPMLATVFDDTRAHDIGYAHCLGTSTTAFSSLLHKPSTPDGAALQRWARCGRKMPVSTPALVHPATSSGLFLLRSVWRAIAQAGLASSRFVVTSCRASRHAHAERRNASCCDGD